jgi:hypothetical protein
MLHPDSCGAVSLLQRSSCLVAVNLKKDRKKQAWQPSQGVLEWWGKAPCSTNGIF